MLEGKEKEQVGGGPREANCSELRERTVGKLIIVIRRLSFGNGRDDEFQDNW